MQTLSSSLLTSPSRAAHLRQSNTKGLLQLLRAHNPCSKADLVRLSGLSAPTVSIGVSHLEQLGLVESLGDGESSGGRPPAILRFNATHAYVASADIGGTRLRMMLADLNGVPVAQWSTVLLKGQKTAEEICALVVDGLKIMCGQSGVSVKKVLHLTAGAPGVTDTDAGVVLAAPNLKNWNDVPLRSLLEKATGLHVIVENDTNLAAIGEYHHGIARGMNDFLFIGLGTGVGAGIFIAGKIYHGAHWRAGEVGYFGVTGSRRQAILVRETGQLEREIGGAGIEAHWNELLLSSKSSEAPELGKLRVSQIFDLARDGDPMARKVLNRVAEILADLIAEAALLLDPKAVILGGGVGCHEQLCRATQAQLARHELSELQVLTSSLGTQAQLFGGVALSLFASEADLLLEKN
jgi:glucokinase